jgi:type II secretion system protein C
MSRFIHTLKWLLAGVLVWTVGWAVMVYRHCGPGLGPSAVMAVEDSPHTQAAPEPGLIQVPEVDYARLLSHDPFGGSPVPALRASESPAQPPGGLPGVALVGTVSGEAPLARAILQDTKTKATTVHRIGDRVGDAILEGVSRDAAVFVAGGRRLVLKRTDSGSPAAGAGRPREPSDASRAAAPRVAEVQAVPPRPGADVLQQFLYKVTATPVLTDQGMEGLRVTGLDEIPAARQWGLEDGDVICAVNGQNLGDPRKAFQILRKARSQQSIQIELVRKGQNKTLAFDLR